MKIERVRVFGFEPAFFGMRNPKESWDRSDSTFYEHAPHWPYPIDPLDRGKVYNSPHWHPSVIVPEFPEIGPKDMDLACSLIKGGSEHRKFLRQIMIWVNITIPRYCWQELDTYKVATVRMSCSTMHKLGHRLLVQEDFEQPIEEQALKHLNELVGLFQEATDVSKTATRVIRRKLKNDLPEGYLQMATYTLSYETALSILRQRHNHRLDEWHWEVTGSICNWLLTLPYLREFAQALLGALIAPEIPEGISSADLGSEAPASDGK